jgi:Fic family protein
VFRLQKGDIVGNRDSNGAVADWQAWVMFMLKGIEVTAAHTITIVNGINRLMAEYKAALRPEFGKSYRHELLNHLFFHPYTKIDHTTEALGVTRMTASAYLKRIVKLGLLEQVKVWKSNYYINRKLTDLLINHAELEDK